jgi:hypothetical protein
MSKGRPLLRAGVLVAAALGTLFTVGGVWNWWRIPQGHRDGLELIGLAAALLYFAVLVLPMLVLALLKRWLPFAAVLAVIALVLASDALVPWIPRPSRSGAIGRLMPLAAGWSASYEPHEAGAQSQPVGSVDL